MAFKYKTTEYGKMIVKINEKTPCNRAIFYIHDFYDKPENIKEFYDQLMMFDFYGVFFPMDQVEEKFLNNNNWDLLKFYSYVKDILISLNLDEIYLMGNGFGATIALMIAEELKLNFVKLILINPLVSKVSRHTIENLKNFPRNIDETYDLMKKNYIENDIIFSRDKEGNEVIDNARRFVYNHFIYKKIIFDFLSQANITALRKIEKRNYIPTLVIISGSDHLFLSSEIESTYRNSDTVTTVQILDAAHYPWRDNYKEFIDNVMKFLFAGDKLYSDKKLPPEYLYKYLSDEVKENFKQAFGKQIEEREKKEQERIAKENEILEDFNKAAMSEEEVEYYMQFQTETLHASIENAKKYIDKIKNTKIDNEDFITFDIEKHRPNIIYVTKEGYNAYHDGMGNNFYQLKDSKTWTPSIYNKKEDDVNND